MADDFLTVVLRPPDDDQRDIWFTGSFTNTSNHITKDNVMKKTSYLLLATVLSFAGAQVGLACKKAIKHSAPTNVKLKVELERSILPAGKTERAVIKIALQPALVLRDAANRPPANVAIVLDRSGSMSGVKIEQAKEAAIQAVRRLGAKDIVSLVAYDHQVHTIIPAQSVKNPEALVALIRNIRSGGNTAL